MQETDESLLRPCTHRRGSTESCAAGDEQQIVTIPVILMFVAFTSIMMFVLFFVLNKWIFYIFVGLFAYGSAVASGVCMHTLVATFQPAWLRPTLPIKWSAIPKIRVSDVTIGAVAITAAVVWAIFRCAQSAVAVCRFNTPFPCRLVHCCRRSFGWGSAGRYFKT